MKTIIPLKIACIFLSIEAMAVNVTSDIITQDTQELNKTPPKLNVEERPEELQSIIDSAFEAIAGDRSSRWGKYNGTAGYDMMEYSEENVLKNLILKLPSTQDTFTCLDIGAGNFQWGDFILKYFSEQNDFPDHLRHIRIISMRGEKNLEQEISVNTKESSQIQITKYNFGQFKIENLNEEFQKRNLELENQVDYIISRWCFRHLVDPVGTFQQAYNLLKPNQGIFMGDGFYFSMNDIDIDSAANEQFLQLLSSTTAPFLTMYYQVAGSLDSFVLKRRNDTPLAFPVAYNKAKKINADKLVIGSGHVTDFTGELPTMDFDTYESNKRLSVLFGNDEDFFKEFTALYPFDWLKQPVKKRFIKL